MQEYMYLTVTNAIPENLNYQYYLGKIIIAKWKPPKKFQKFGIFIRVCKKLNKKS